MLGPIGVECGTDGIATDRLASPIRVVVKPMTLPSLFTARLWSLLVALTPAPVRMTVRGDGGPTDLVVRRSTSHLIGSR
jgi:hypothetical protein